MKKSAILTAIAVIGTAVATAQVTEERTTTTTTTSGGSGVITEYSPGTAIVLKESSGPIRYRLGKTVTYVTKSGKTISAEEVNTRIRVGAPVHVEFSGEGDARVVERVVVEDEDD